MIHLDRCCSVVGYSPLPSLHLLKFLNMIVKIVLEGLSSVRIICIHKQELKKKLLKATMRGGVISIMINK